MCHHPPEFVGCPVVWFCDSFTQFLEDLQSTVPIPRKYYDITQNLCMEMSKTYNSFNGNHEDARIKAFDECFLAASTDSSLLYHVFQTSFHETILRNNSRSDGFLTHHTKDALIGVREFKNEVGK